MKESTEQTQDEIKLFEVHLSVKTLNIGPLIQYGNGNFNQSPEQRPTYPMREQNNLSQIAQSKQQVE